MASKEGLNNAFAAMLGGLPEPAAEDDKKNVAKPKEKKAEPKKQVKKEKVEDAPVEKITEDELVVVETELIHKKSKKVLRDKRKQFMITEEMCDKLKRYSEEYEISENEIICQLLNRLP